MPTSFKTMLTGLLAFFSIFICSLNQAMVASNIVVIGSNVDDEGGVNIVLSSSDGRIFTPQMVPNSPHFWDVSLANNKYIVVGQCRANLLSKDGITFSSYATPFCLERIIWSHNQYFSFFNDPDTTSVELYSSPDGINYTKRFTGTDLAIWGIARGNGKYVAVGYNNVNPDPKDFGLIVTSPDGNHWTVIPKTNIPGQLFDIVWMCNQFVAIGTVIITSKNGTDWVNHKLNFPFRLYSIGFGNNTLVAVGQSGMIVTSRDGTHWSQQASGTENDLKKVAWINSIAEFVAVGSFGTILTSRDGVN